MSDLPDFNIPLVTIKQYKIRVHSCKKDTEITYYLTDEQAQLLREIAVATQLLSTSECEPTVHVTQVGKLTTTRRVKTMLSKKKKTTVRTVRKNGQGKWQVFRLSHLGNWRVEGKGFEHSTSAWAHLGKLTAKEQAED